MQTIYGRDLEIRRRLGLACAIVADREVIKNGPKITVEAPEYALRIYSTFPWRSTLLH